MIDAQVNFSEAFGLLFGIAGVGITTRMNHCSIGITIIEDHVSRITTIPSRISFQVYLRLESLN